MDYYFDTCIWIDFFEDRRNLLNEKLGDKAHKLILENIKGKNKIIFSDAVYEELCKYIDRESIDSSISFLDHTGKIININSTKEQFMEAKEISKERGTYIIDVLHAILARDNDAILVTRDRHFEKLRDIVEVKHPRELI